MGAQHENRSSGRVESEVGLASYCRAWGLRGLSNLITVTLQHGFLPGLYHHSALKVSQSLGMPFVHALRYGKAMPGVTALILCLQSLRKW
jgi:hypothetical protein